MHRWARTVSALAVASAALSLAAPSQAASAPVLQFSASPSASYGSLDVGQSLDQTFTLTNRGGTATASLRVALSASTAFAIPPGGDKCTAVSLGPKKTCTVTVRYTPAAQGANDSATLTASARKPALRAILALSGSSPLPPLAACQQALAAAGYTAPVDPNYILGTAGEDDFSAQMTLGNDVICGFAGDDKSENPFNGLGLGLGDIFLGAAGNDFASSISNRAAFEGGAGNDTAEFLEDASSTFNGGEGNDAITYAMFKGTFNGGEGNDATTKSAFGGTFNGDAGNDSATKLSGTTFNGGDGDDSVAELATGTFSSTFNGEDGCDSVGIIGANGTFNPGDQSTCLPS